MNARGFARTGMDLLCGILAGAAAVLQSAVAFGGKIGLSIAAAVIAVPIAVLLLRHPVCLRRRLRSITALLTYPLTAFLMIRLGGYDAVYAIINPAYVREFGGPNVGDAGGLFLLYFPGALILLLLAVLLAREFSKPDKRSESTEESS